MAKLDQDDLKAIKNLLVETIKDKVDDGTVAGGEAVSHLPTKEQFYAHMAKLMGEVAKSREEQTAISHQAKDLSNRLEKLEKIHPGLRHQVPA